MKPYMLPKYLTDCFCCSCSTIVKSLPLPHELCVEHKLRTCFREIHEEISESRRLATSNLKALKPYSLLNYDEIGQECKRTPFVLAQVAAPEVQFDAGRPEVTQHPQTASLNRRSSWSHFGQGAIQIRALTASGLAKVWDGNGARHSFCGGPPQASLAQLHFFCACFRDAWDLVR